jgi:hypothetical protein
MVIFCYYSPIQYVGIPPTRILEEEMSRQKIERLSINDLAQEIRRHMKVGWDESVRLARRAKESPGALVPGLHYVQG